ncbi:MAG TPA: MFS transporter [bacterium]|nr:MFS transporter [bacterium]
MTTRHILTRDSYLLLAARGLRMFSYGFLSVVLALYLSGLGFSVIQIGVLFTVALAGGAVVTGGVSIFANRWGRRTILIASSILMALGGIALATGRFPLMLIFAALATLSPTAQEIGPFQSLEQAALSETSIDPSHVMPYAWYNLVGYLAVAVGALVAGVVPAALQGAGWSALEAQRALVWAFSVIGLILAGLYLPLSPSIEGQRQRSPRHLLGLHRSRGIVLRLTALFGVDALAGGLIVQSLVAYWFHQRFGIGLAVLGPLFFGTNLLSALSSLVAAALAARVGLLNTMVFTHLPSNVLLGLIPFMPTWPVAAAVLLARHALSQMDVPTRQAYTMALVAPEERVAAAGLTNAVRPAAASLAPAISGIAFQAAANGLPFILAGGIKILYDLALWSMFRRASIVQHDRDATQ